MLIAMLAIMMAACQKKEPVDPTVPVTLTADGTGTFQVAYHIDHWVKFPVTDYWTMTVRAMPGDTIYLSTSTNEHIVSLSVNDLGRSVAPDTFYMIQYIVP